MEALPVYLLAFFAVCMVQSGVEALRFLHNPPKVKSSHRGMDAEFNCTTDDLNATVSLLFSNNFGGNWVVVKDKLSLKGQVFTLMNIIFVNGGQYKCKATDMSGQSVTWKEPVLLFILPAELPDYFELIPDKEIYVLQGQARNVTCECKGVSVSNLKWEVKRSGKTSYEAVPSSWEISRKDSDNNKVIDVLAIPNAQLSDSGVYKCTVTVNKKSDFKLINIQVKAPESPTVYPYTGEKTIKEKSTKVIKCEASGAPKPTVSWYRNGKKLNDTNCGRDPKSCENIVYEVYEEGDDPSGVHTIYTTQVLKIRSALYPRDNGEFKCVASNGVPPDDEMSINVVVQAPPTILKLGNQVLVKEGNEVNISCKLEKGNPLPTFKWQILNPKCKVSENCKPDESQWQSVPQKLITPTGTPTNESVVKVESNQDSTFYRCQAFNSLGNDSHVVRLIRGAKPKAMAEIDTVKTGTEHNEQSTLHVYCIDRCGLFCNPFFTKDGKKLPPVNDSRIIATHKKPGNKEGMLVLTVKNLTLNDSGNYRCSLDIDPTVFSGINITIKALVAPNVAEIPDVKVRQEQQGKGLQLKCQATGNPIPSITWFFYKDGKGKPELVNKENNNLGGNIDNCQNRKQGYYFMWPGDRSSLVICNPQFEKNQGKYHCHVSNLVGSMDKFAFVDVDMAPVIIEPKPDIILPALEIGDLLNVTCKANGNPTPNVTWIKNSTGEIVTSSPTNTQLLIIESMKEEDFGEYLCIASNKLKSTVVSIHVKQGVALECYGCSDDPEQGPKCTSANLTKVTCNASLFMDRCYTVKLKMMGMSFSMRNCAPNISCNPESQYYLCKVLNDSVGNLFNSCDVKCCEGDLCDPDDVAMTPEVPVSTKPPTSSLKCQACGSGTDNPCDDANVTTIECDPAADRCVTVHTTMGSVNMVMKSCANSTMHCQKQGQYYPCKVIGSFPGASCDVTCCQGDLCNQASTGPDPATVAPTPSASVTAETAKPVNTSLFNSTIAGGGALECYKCSDYPGQDSNSSCASANLTKVTCSPYLDRCFTTKAKMFGMSITARDCAPSMYCNPDYQDNPCNLLLNSTGDDVATCDMKCCKDDLCDPDDVATTPGVPASIKPPSGGLECYKCSDYPGQDSNSSCASANLTKVTCSPYMDRCFTTKAKIFGMSITARDCAPSMYCNPDYQYNPCNLLLNNTGDNVASCDMKCCKDDLCDPDDVATTPEVPASIKPPTSSLRCQSCGPGQGPCDGDNVKIMECPAPADRCVSVFVAMTIPNLETQMSMVMKSCSNSTITCEEQSKFYPCKQLQDYQHPGARVTACKVTCCQGDLCNQASTQPVTVAPRPSPSAVTGRWRRVNSSPVCFKAKDNQYGKFSVPSSGKLAAIKLVHLYGYVSCDPKSNTRWSYWGCAVSKVNVVITTSANRVILPPKQFMSNAVKWSKIPGYSSLSNEIVLSVISRPLWVRSGQELRLWFGEDLVNQGERDNGGKVCCDVYALYV